MGHKRNNSALAFVLKGLVPYTKENITLAFKPGHFFAELEKTTNAGRYAVRSAYYRAHTHKFIEFDDKNIPRITKAGWQQIERFSPQKLGKNARLMIIFDIPEEEAWKRQRLRRLLRELNFVQIQKSVWCSDYDQRELLKNEIQENKLQDYVQIYEASPLKIT